MKKVLLIVASMFVMQGITSATENTPVQQEQVNSVCNCGCDASCNCGGCETTCTCSCCKSISMLCDAARAQCENSCSKCYEESGDTMCCDIS